MIISAKPSIVTQPMPIAYPCLDSNLIPAIANKIAKVRRAAAKTMNIIIVMGLWPKAMILNRVAR
jgi:hypothetical protein